MTVREHYRKFGDIELLELLYDDLKTWNTWVLEKRSLQPVGLISVGSDPVNTASASHPVPHTQCPPLPPSHTHTRARAMTEGRATILRPSVFFLGAALCCYVIDADASVCARIPMTSYRIVAGPARRAQQASRDMGDGHG